MSISTIHERQMAPHKRRARRFQVCRSGGSAGLGAYVVDTRSKYRNVTFLMTRKMAEVIRDALNERYEND